MSVRALRLARLAILLVVLALLPAACSEPPSDEDIVRQYIAEGVAAINARDRTAAMQHVRPGLRVRRGGMLVDPEGLMRLYFHRYREVHAFVYDVEVTLAGSRAEARFKAVLLGGNRTLPENANIFEVVSQWEKDEDWQLTDITWQRKLIELPPEVREWFSENAD